MQKAQQPRGIKIKMSWGGGRVGPGYKSQEKRLQATLYNRTSQRPSTEAERAEHTKGNSTLP